MRALLKIAAAQVQNSRALIVPQKVPLSLQVRLSYKHKIPEDVSRRKAFEMGSLGPIVVTSKSRFGAKS